MMGVQIWNKLRLCVLWTAPRDRKEVVDGFPSWEYYQRIDVLTAQGVKF